MATAAAAIPPAVVATATATADSLWSDALGVASMWGAGIGDELAVGVSTCGDVATVDPFALGSGVAVGASLVAGAGSVACGCGVGLATFFFSAGAAGRLA